MLKKSPVLVVEDDVWARLIAVVLDPATSAQRTAAFADFMSPDEPDFPAWCERTRQGAGNSLPARSGWCPPRRNCALISRMPTLW